MGREEVRLVDSMSFGSLLWQHSVVQSFSEIKPNLLERLGSYHRHVLVRLLTDNEVKRGQFWFDKRWAEDPSFKDMIDEAWNSESLPTRRCIMD